MLQWLASHALSAYRDSKYTLISVSEWQFCLIQFRLLVWIDVSCCNVGSSYFLMWFVIPLHCTWKNKKHVTSGCCIFCRIFINLDHTTSPFTVFFRKQIETLELFWSGFILEDRNYFGSSELNIGFSNCDIVVWWWVES